MDLRERIKKNVNENKTLFIRHIFNDKFVINSLQIFFHNDSFRCEDIVINIQFSDSKLRL